MINLLVIYYFQSFPSDMTKNKDKISTMLNHLVTGKSFEYICAAGIAMGNLHVLALKLIE